nr:MAG: replication associated protein [Arizlama virus]
MNDKKIVNAVCVWDFTVGVDYVNLDDLLKSMKTHCKKYSFQKEKGEETGFIHFQGRVSLKIKQRLSGIIALFGIKEMHWSITSKPNRDNTFYVTKEESRIEGPWSDESKDIYIPYQYKGILDNLRPFQQSIFDKKDDRDPRKVNIVIDERGNRGKSSLAAIMEIMGYAIDMPPCNDGEKLVQSLLDMCYEKTRDPKVIFIDLPRSMNQEKLFGMYTAIEQIKKGKLYDFRYNYKSWWIDAPQIWVFCNTEPHRGYISRDRWNMWYINDSNELVATK